MSDLAILRIQTFYRAKGICECGHTGSGLGQHGDPSYEINSKKFLNFHIGTGPCKVGDCGCGHYRHAQDSPEWEAELASISKEEQEWRALDYRVATKDSQELEFFLFFFVLFVILPLFLVTYG